MKVAFVHYHLKTGGVTSVLHRQAECIHHDCDVLVITGTSPGEDFPFPFTVIEAIGYDRPDRPTPPPEQIAQEIEQTIGHDVIVCDRSVLDNYAYMVQKFGRIQVFDGIIASWISTYDYLVKVPILTAPSYDGLRDTRGDYQQEIDRVIESLIRDFRVECVRLPTWSRDNWVEQVIESLSLGTEQLGLFEEGSPGSGGAG